MKNTILETGLIMRIIWEISKTKTGYKLTFKQHEKLVGSKNYNPSLRKVRYFKEYPKNFSFNGFNSNELLRAKEINLLQYHLNKK